MASNVMEKSWKPYFEGKGIMYLAFIKRSIHTHTRV